jgi:hypothetical protein
MLSPKETRCYEYLLQNKGITSQEAIKYLGDTRLSATIFNLRNKGFKIKDIWETDVNRYGEDVRYKKYFLK